MVNSLHFLRIIKGTTKSLCLIQIFRREMHRAEHYHQEIKHRKHQKLDPLTQTSIKRKR